MENPNFERSEIPHQENNGGINFLDLIGDQPNIIEIAKSQSESGGASQPDDCPTILEPGPPGQPRSDHQEGNTERTQPGQLPREVEELEIPCLQDYKMTIAPFQYRDYSFMCKMEGMIRALPQDAVNRPKFPPDKTGEADRMRHR